MILAAADLAAGRDVEPPSELIALWDWRDTSTPPVAGGLRDQPAGLLRRAKYLEAVYHIMQRWYRGGKIEGPQEQAIFKRVLDLRKQRNVGIR